MKILEGLRALGRLKAGGSRRTESGWFVMTFGGDALDYVHCRRADSGKPAVTRCGRFDLAAARGDAARVSRDLHLERYQCATLLAPRDYQLLLVDAPNVPQAELKTAIRWHVKNLLDYHVDDATVDVLDIPRDPSRASGTHSMYAVTAKNETIKACIDRFDQHKLPLAVIDISETAQRNVASLYETDARGVALLYLTAEQGLLTVSCGGELYLARRIEAGTDQLRNATAAQREEVFNRIVLELQRTFDHFDRQFGYVRIGKILLGPEPFDSGLAGFLGSNLDLPVERVRLSEVMDFEAGPAPGDEAQWRMFHLFGAALRQESKVL